MMGPSVMIALPRCYAGLWPLPILLEGSCPAMPQASVCIAKDAMQEQEVEGWEGEAIGWGKYNYLPLFCW